jgi:predicted metal-binding membrane protein
MSRATRAAFLAVAALLMAAGIAGTIAAADSMADMGAMDMPGGWSLSMTWMRMPGQSWREVAQSFLGMWLVMTVAMMLPAVLPALWRYRQAQGGRRHPNMLTLLAAAGYFSVWLLWAAAVLPLGAAVAQLTLHWSALARAVPAAAALLVLGAGAVQLSPWKARQLGCCRQPQLSIAAGPGAALRHGLTLGLTCSRCCGNLMLVLPAIGLMDLAVMTLVTLAIVLERLVSGASLPRLTGVVLIATGALLLARAAALAV